MITTLTLPKWMASPYATLPSHQAIAAKASNWNEDVKAVYHGSLFTDDHNEPQQFDESHVPVFKDPQPQHNHQQDADSKPRATVDDGNGQQHSRANSKKAEAIYRENVVTIVFLITKQIIKFNKNCEIGGGSSNSSSSDGSTASGKESASEDSDCCLKKDITDGNNSEEVGAFNAMDDSSSEGMDASDCILNMNLTTVTLEINNPSSHHSGRKSNSSNSSSEEGSRIKIRSVNMVLNDASFNSQPQQERALFYAIGETLFKLFGKQESISVGRLISSNMDVKKSSNGNNTTSSKIDQQSESSDDDELFENSMMKALSILDEESAVEEIPERMNTSCQAASPVVIDLVGRVASPNSRATVASPLSCSPSVATMASPALPDSEPIGANEQRHPKRNKKPSNNPHYSTFLQIQNQHPTFPIAVVRLISDLIDSSKNAEDDSKSTNNTISNSRSRRRKLLFRSLKDVIEDLKQMVIEPSIFLHDSQDTSAIGKLDFGTILYGRQAEIHQLLQVAKTIENQQLNIGGRLEMFSIEGYSGSGKSALVRHVGKYLSITKGWFFLQAKFDRMRQNDALSVVTSTFENYCIIIQFLKTRECSEDLKYCSKVPGALMKALGHEGIASLSHLIPSLVHVAGSREGKSSSSLSLVSKTIHTASDAVMSQSRLEYLLLAFAETILSLGRPILLFYDDMQWAEFATLEFLSKLVKRLADHSDARKNLLYIQAFRDNEVDGTDPLHVVMSPAISHDSTNFSQIKLCGFDKKELNGVLSEALRLPCRITRPLSEIVHQKTMGNIMFVIEFMKTLQDPRKKMLYYSVSKHRWRWDADSIALTSITGNVAGLLMNKLLCIEKNTLDCLIIASCFGSQVNSSVIQNLEGMKGTVNMIENLEAMVVEGLLEKAGPLFMFVHDAIQQTVYEISQENERLQLHIEIGSMLISKSSRAPIDGIEEIFALAVDQINMALKLGGDIAMIFTPSQRVTFAKLNLRAGQKDINDKSDFSSAKVHLSAAISFLPGNCWADQYNLTLQIYDEYTNVLLAKREFQHLFVHIDVILKEATCLGDKISAHEALISALHVSGSISKSVGHARAVIAALGFPFPAYAEEEAIFEIMNNIRRQSEGFTQDHIHFFPLMDDPVILQAMRIMSIVMFPCNLIDPTMFLLITCQMMQLTITHGLCVDSSTAFAYFGYAQTSQYRNYDDGYRMGKLAMAILDRFNARNRIASVSFIVHGFLNIWKEPFQATIERLQYSIDKGFKIGDQDNALLNSVICGRQEILAGKNLLALSKKLEHVCRAMTYDKSKNRYFVSFNPMLGDLYLVTSLTGGSNERLSSMFISHSENEKILLEGPRASHDTTVNQLVNYHRCCKAFWFRDYTTVIKYCESYDNIHQTLRKKLIRITDICNSFYGGLAMFILSRKIKEDKLIADGETHLLVMKTWEAESKWNFENKSLLLEAECHYAKGENEDAMRAYAKSISSARDHKFIHEEALAKELFGIFCVETGNRLKGGELMDQAHQLYTQWGAHKKAMSLYPI